MKKKDLLKLKSSVLSVIAATTMLSGCANIEEGQSKCSHSDRNDIHYHYMSKDVNGNVVVYRDCNSIIDVKYDSENTTRVDCFGDPNILQGGVLYDTSNEEMLKEEEEAIKNGAVVCSEEYGYSDGTLLQSLHNLREAFTDATLYIHKLK